MSQNQPPQATSPAPAASGGATADSAQGSAGTIDRRTLLGGALATAALGAIAATQGTTTASAATAATAAPGATSAGKPAVARAGRMPTLYLPHGGGPCFFMDWTMGPADTWVRMADWLRGIPASLPAQPKALLVISAHWEQSAATLLTAPKPPLLFDYYGFPKHTYELTWPAPNAVDLLPKVEALLRAAGIPTAHDASRGYDHGVFVPLKLAFPRADIPTMQLSLRAGLDPAAHLALGRALAPLRDQGVLIVGSGMSYHNMRGFMQPQSLAASKAFDAWLAETVAKPADERASRLQRWAEAPAARASHPREEHLLPLMVCAGAAGDDAGKVDFRDIVMGVQVAAHRFG